jgi:hypothetical protein
MSLAGPFGPDEACSKLIASIVPVAPGFAAELG